MSVANALHHLLFKAFYCALRPLARLAYTANLDCSQFVEITKLAFADVAASDYGIRNRPTNKSRTALIMGLTRKESKRLRDRLTTDDPFRDVPVTRVDRVLQHWHTDPRFVTAAGHPRTLPYDGPGASFTQLCARSAGDVPPGAVRAELLRLQAMRKNKRGYFEVRRSIGLDASIVQPILDNLDHFVTPAATAVAHNVIDSPQEPWPAAAVCLPTLAASNLEGLRSISQENVEQTCQQMARLFDSYQVVSDDAASERDTASAGFVVFHYEDAALAP